MIKLNYEFEVLVNGKPLKEYTHEGKIFIEGRKDTSFSLRLRNNSSSRKLFIPTIDGLSVMDGKDASFNSSGYIVKPWSSVTIDGWRISDSKVAEFYFSSPKDSYRKRMGKGNNVGIIGCAVFDEKVKEMPKIYTTKVYVDCRCGGHCHHHNTTTAPWQFNIPSYGNYGTSGAANSNFAAASLSASSHVTRSMSNVKADLGTGWGEEKQSEVTTVEFDRVSHPDTVFEISYNTREQLERIGVNFKKETLYVAPQAFPGQYCEPPERMRPAHSCDVCRKNKRQVVCTCPY